MIARGETLANIIVARRFVGLTASTLSNSGALMQESEMHGVYQTCIQPRLHPVLRIHRATGNRATIVTLLAGSKAVKGFAARLGLINKSNRKQPVSAARPR